MFKREDIVLSRSGSAISGAVVRVSYYPSGVLAPIYSTDDSSLSAIIGSEVTTNDDGEYAYYVPPGRYTETVLVGGVIQQVKNDVQLVTPDVYNEQTGTTYTLKASDNGKIVRLTNAAAITLTAPQTSTESIPVPFMCAIVQGGAGQVTVVKQGADTLESSGSLVKLFGQHSLAIITKRTAGSPNVYQLFGDLTA